MAIMLVVAVMIQSTTINKYTVGGGGGSGDIKVVQRW
jgi:preprotein translocase subunit SecG